MKFYAHLTPAPLDAKAQMNVIQGRQTTRINIALVLLIALNIVQQMSITVLLAKLLTAANCQMNVLKKQEVLMGNYAHSIALKFVPINNYSVKEESMKLDARPLVHV
jgi:hypothetical protein